MSWGRGITIGLITFMGFITFLVVSLMRHKVDLVSEDYYQQELDYNNHFDAATVYSKTGEKITVELTESTLKINIPATMANDSIGLQLKRPDNELQDLNLRVKAQPVIAIPFNRLKKGRYDITLTGKFNHQNYLFQESVFIP
jgi:hypothetical protein